MLVYLYSSLVLRLLHLFPHDLGDEPSIFFSLCNCIAKHCTVHAASPTALLKTVGMTCSDYISWFLSESFSFHFSLSGMITGIIHTVTVMYVVTNSY